MTPRLRGFAERNNCSVHLDRDLDVAIQARHYTSDGMKVVRHTPDPCHFYTTEKWAEAWDQGRASDLIC